MKRYILTLMISFVSLIVFSQGTFRYSTMRNKIWGKWRPSVTRIDQYLINKVNDNEWIIYRDYDHPSNYLIKFRIDNFYIDKDKKSRKEHFKNNQWYVFTGSVEIFTDAETFVRKFPFVPTYDKPEIKNLSIPARIKVQPFKKRIKTINIFFDDVGLGLSFR